jgi:hypothetical protein
MRACGVSRRFTAHDLLPKAGGQPDAKPSDMAASVPIFVCLCYRSSRTIFEMASVQSTVSEAVATNSMSLETVLDEFPQTRSLPCAIKLHKLHQSPMHWGPIIGCGYGDGGGVTS